jgi:nucleoside-diphosphate-sugar epimerase
MTETIIVGCGYVGTRLARQYLDRGRTLTALVRSAAAQAQLKAMGINAVRCNLASEDPSGISMAGVQLFHFAPPPDQGQEDPSTRRLVRAFEHSGQPRRILYISTTGVYGDCAGAWVDESWPVRPTADRAHRRWDAEQTLHRWSRETGGELVILRVAGIYGPNRLPLERIRLGVPLVEVAESPFTNRIHVDDLVAVCAAAMDKGGNGAIYNVSDGSPSTMTDYFLQVADAAGLTRPPLIPMAEAAQHLSAGMMSYMAESRRLDNSRLRKELGVQFRYPTLPDGLGTIFQES